MNGFMHPDRSRLRTALLACAASIGVLAGAIAGYGCSTPQPARRAEPLPVAADHRAPRVAPLTEPPAAVQAAAPAADAFEPRPFVPAAEPDLRVRIAALRSATAAPRVSHSSGALVVAAPGVEPRTLRVPVEVRLTAGGMTVVERAGTSAARALTIAGRVPLDFRAPVGARAEVTYDGTDWPGSLRIVPIASTAGMDLVVSVPLERYLPGVLARELYKNWSPETFRAQAIAARSFAICEHAHWTAVRHYDLVAGEASQAWIGEVKDARARQAVADTRGMVLAYEERVVPAYYSSTCGGVPANAVDALTRNPNHGIAPLLAGTDPTNARRDCCRSAPKYRWEQTLPVARVLAQLRRWAGDQLSVERGTLARANAGSPAPAGASPWRTDAPVSAAALGGPVAGTVRMDGIEPAPGAGSGGGSGGDAEASSDSGANAFSAGDEIATDAPLEALARISGLQSIEVIAANQAGRPIRVRLVDARGARLDMRAEDFRRAVNYAREGEPTPRERLNSSLFRARVSGASIVFTGSGFGHGVGMCQFGAEALAQRGATAAQILRTYYPGAAVRKAY
jgi:stage II sporulation protein D